MDTLREVYEKNKRLLLLSLISTFFWGLAAHAYRFFNNIPSHDSLNEFHGAIWGNTHKIMLGRIFVPLYQDMARGDLSIPWMIGLLALIWIGLSVFLVAKMFKMGSRPLVFLTAGIFTTNITVSATAATYLHDLDCYAFSLLCAVTAVYLWNRNGGLWARILGAVLIALSIGMYQSFVFVAVTLMMFLCILALLDGQSFHTVFYRGLLAVVIIVVGGLLYAVALKLVTGMVGVQLYTNEYNTLDKVNGLTIATLPGLVLGSYCDFFYRLIHMSSSYPGILISAIVKGLFLICGVVLVYGLCCKKLSLPEKLLCCILTVLLPLGMDLIYVLTIAESHDLMVYAIWLFFLLALLLSRWLLQAWKDGKLKTLGICQHLVCMLLILVVLYGNVQFANGLYLKKDIEYDAYLSLMTRVINRIEENEDYSPGETPVVFVGLPKILSEVEPGFKDYWSVTGMRKTDVIYVPQRSYFKAYVDYVLGGTVALAGEDVWKQIYGMDSIRQMPCFPSRDCVKLVDGIVVVKLGNYY